MELYSEAAMTAGSRQRQQQLEEAPLKELLTDTFRSLLEGLSPGKFSHWRHFWKHVVGNTWWYHWRARDILFP